MSKRETIDTPVNIAMAALFCIICTVVSVVGMSQSFERMSKARQPVSRETMIQVNERSFILDRAVESLPSR